MPLVAPTKFARIQDNLNKLAFDQRQIFFWTEVALVFDWCHQRLRSCVENLDLKERQEFAANHVPKSLLDTARAEIHCAKISDVQIADCCQVWQSYDTAVSLLILEARGERRAVVCGGSVGSIRLEGKAYALSQVERDRRVDGRITSKIIRQALKQNDTQFFIRLGEALQSKRKKANVGAEVDWEQCDELDWLLVNYWCHGSESCRMPPLCLFTGSVLADFCAIALGRERGNPSVAAIEQRVAQRGLSLRRATQSRIRSVKVDAVKRIVRFDSSL